jgi:hypothetical protein
VSDGRQELCVLVEHQRHCRVLDDDGPVRNRLDDHLVLVLGRALVGRAAKAENLGRLVIDLGGVLVGTERDLKRKNDKKD